MAKRWIPEIRQRRQLSVHPGPALMGSGWAVIFNEALREFNTLSRRHNLGVTMVRSPDPPTTRGGADVEMEAADGQVSRTFAGETMTRTLSGRIMHGATLLVSRDAGIEKAFIFVPMDPQASTPWGVRSAGPPVRRLIAIHELVHACGLEDSDHSRDDLFHGSPQVDAGRRPVQDRIGIMVNGRRRWMPPFVLSGSTIDVIRKVWKP